MPRRDPLWVRWQEALGWTAWMEVEDVSTDGPWLRVDLLDGGWVLVPDHIVRGRVEVQGTAPEVWR